MSEKDKNNSYTPNAINNYDDLIKTLSKERDELNKKNKNTYWSRYIFRRAPLFLGAGLTFFLACFLMATTKEIDLKSINAFLNSLVTPVIRKHNYVFLAIYVFFIIMYTTDIITYFKETSNESASRKVAATAILFISLVVIFITAISNKHPVFFGLATFASLTIFSLLTDRVIGYTRRNERYQLFAGRAESLCVLFASRKNLGIQFQESHLLELAKFYEELRQSKYNDTVADSHYLLTLVEQLKAPSK